MHKQKYDDNATRENRMSLQNFPRMHANYEFSKLLSEARQ